jgi:hypothetical protein
VTHLLEDFYFSGDPLYVFLVINFVLFQDFDGYFFAREDMCALLDLAKSALAKSLA